MVFGYVQVQSFLSHHLPYSEICEGYTREQFDTVYQNYSLPVAESTWIGFEETDNFNIPA